MKPAPRSGAFRNVVVLRTDRIGDLLVSTPAIRNVRRALPDARITLVTSPACKDVLWGWDAIDAVDVFDAAASRDVRVATTDRLRALRPDLVFAFTPQPSVYMLARRTRARVRAGFGYRSRPLDAAVARFALTHPVLVRVPEAVERAREVPHHAEELMATLPAVGLPAAPCRMEVPIADGDRHWATCALAERGQTSSPLVLHLSHKWLDEGWSPREVVALIDGLATIAGNARLTATVGPADTVLWRQVRPMLGEERRLVVFEDLTFGRWAALVATAALVISTDTAALHLASATGRSVVGVYAMHRFHVLSRQWGPWMVPSRTVRKEPGGRGVEAIVNCVGSLHDEISGE